MVSTLCIEQKSKYLVMTIQGRYCFEKFIEYPRQVLQYCQENGKDKVLVDLKNVPTEDVPIIELFFIGEKIAEILDSKIKVALLWSCHSLSEFLYNVATNRQANLVVFESLKEADSWLNEED